MNLDELKTAWQVYDSRLMATEEINHKVIISMIRERSVSRISRIRNRYTEMICLFLFYVICYICLFFGDPSIYTSRLQYLLLATFMLSCIAISVSLFRARILLKKISLDRENLWEALVHVITVYEKYKKINKYMIIVVLCSTLLLILLGIINDISETGMSGAISSVLCLCALMVFSYYYAGKKPEWPNLEEEEKGLKADMEELKDSGLK